MLPTRSAACTGGWMPSIPARRCGKLLITARRAADLHGRPVAPMAIHAAPEWVVLEMMGLRGPPRATPGGVGRERD
jgi:hypothetical protein